MRMRKCWTCRVSTVAVAYNHLIMIFSYPILLLPLLFQTTMLQNECLVQFQVQESWTQPQNHPFCGSHYNELEQVQYYGME